MRHWGAVEYIFLSIAIIVLIVFAYLIYTAPPDDHECETNKCSICKRDMNGETK